MDVVPEAGGDSSEAPDIILVFYLFFVEVRVLELFW